MSFVGKFVASFVECSVKQLVVFPVQALCIIGIFALIYLNSYIRIAFTEWPVNVFRWALTKIAHLLDLGVSEIKRKKEMKTIDINFEQIFSEPFKFAHDEAVRTMSVIIVTNILVCILGKFMTK